MGPHQKLAQRRSPDATLAAIERPRPRLRVEDPDLRDLLDHLGRLIAQEYITLLRKNRAAPERPAKERKQ